MPAKKKNAASKKKTAKKLNNISRQPQENVTIKKKTVVISPEKITKSEASAIMNAGEAVSCINLVMCILTRAREVVYV
jgi:hypothetical protein